MIPCANQFSMNVGRRFWAADNTDINRMFPGYDGGETTQRIAARIFATIQGYEYGVHFTSFYLPGSCLPHARIMETGYQHPEEALAFGLPYILLRKPQPYDTTTLNYNWQIWDTQAFPLYTRESDCVDHPSACCSTGGSRGTRWRRTRSWRISWTPAPARCGSGCAPPTPERCSSPTGHS